MVKESAKRRSEARPVDRPRTADPSQVPQRRATKPDPEPSPRAAGFQRVPPKGQGGEDGRRLGPGAPGEEDEVRRRAYELYEARGREPGHEAEDWARAEQEVRNRRSGNVRER